MVNPLDREAKRRIVEAILKAEHKTNGEIRVHVKPNCGEDPMKDAQKVFHRLRMHRTKHRSAVLILVAWKSRQFAIVGDAGVHRKVGDSFWGQTRDIMRAHFSKNDIAGGIVKGIESVGEKLKAHFPAANGNKDELSNMVSEGV